MPSGRRVRATRAGRRRGTTTATWVNRFVFLFLSFLERDRTCSVTHSHLDVHCFFTFDDETPSLKVVAVSRSRSSIRNEGN